MGLLSQVLEDHKKGYHFNGLHASLCTPNNQQNWTTHVKNHFRFCQNPQGDVSNQRYYYNSHNQYDQALFQAFLCTPVPQYTYEIRYISHIQQKRPYEETGEMVGGKSVQI